MTMTQVACRQAQQYSTSGAPLQPDATRHTQTRTTSHHIRRPLLAMLIPFRLASSPKQCTSSLHPTGATMCYLSLPPGSLPPKPPPRCRREGCRSDVMLSPSASTHDFAVRVNDLHITAVQCQQNPGTRPGEAHLPWRSCIDSLANGS